MNARKPLRGRIEFAAYKKTGIQEYDDHPLIEALPEILDLQETAKKVKLVKKFDPGERELSPGKRKHCVERLSSFIVPLNKHLEVEEKLSILIRKGYLSRNIANGDHTRRVRNCMMRFERPDIADLEKEKYNIPSPTASGLGIIGISGAGKSTGISRILNLYPQVIVHTEYKVKQLVWLKIDCPVSGTIKQLCLNFIHEISELVGEVEYNTYMGYKTDELIRIMSSLALKHHLGVLVIDEIQYLYEVRSGGAALMLNFFNTLTNTIGVPIVLIGTPKARHLFTREFRNIKRITDQGSVDWDRLQQESNDWCTLVKYIWKYQWTKEYVECTAAIEKALYYESQGIPDLVIKIFKEAQKRAIGSDDERLTEEIIHSVAQDQFRLLQPALDALRSGKKEKMHKYLDIFMSFEPEKMINNEDKELFSKEYGIELDEALIEQKDEQSFTEVVYWIMDMGYAEDQAKEVALEARADDISVWKRAAYMKAMNKYDNDQASISSNRSTPKESKGKKSNSSSNKKATGLMAVIDRKVKSKNTSFHSLIKQAGYVQDVRSRLGL
ncbi:ATP-binding protein [Gorillibacterium massiliense]|uniref:ATP-binding protein n=1 Tax=Gorillibacterium massiliense TaxID=1280390 RepID=UPI0004B12A2A|nr:ATP-binding protein [Gorillibacterium massiliense]